MIDISDIANQRAQDTEFSQKQWEEVIYYGSELDSIGQLTDGEFLQLAKNCSSPEVYNHAVNFFESHLIKFPDGTPAFDLLITEVDESNFTMVGWLQGLSWIMKWQEHHKVMPDFEKSLGYIKCCAMSLEGNPEGDLGSTVKEMLESEGMEN